MHVSVTQASISLRLNDLDVKISLILIQVCGRCTKCNSAGSWLSCTIKPSHPAPIYIFVSRDEKQDTCFLYG